MNTVENILSFWLGDEYVNGFPAKPREALWFQTSLETDKKITELFATDLERAVKGQLDAWCNTARGTLALIILLDQFPRNIYRGSARAFGYDEYARRYCKRGMDAGQDRELRVIERVFFYMPLEHSESQELQDLSVQMMQQLINEAPSQLRKKLQGYLSYAEQHQAIINEFGRFPHRNLVLGRDSTAQELKFLKTGPTFGQG